jgi:hypothetical protein
MTHVLSNYLGVKSLVQQPAEQLFLATCDSQPEKTGA